MRRRDILNRRGAIMAIHPEGLRRKIESPGDEQQRENRKNRKQASNVFRHL